jgi:WD40 repeat protein
MSFVGLEGNNVNNNRPHNNKSIINKMISFITSISFFIIMSFLIFPFVQAICVQVLTCLYYFTYRKKPAAAAATNTTTEEQPSNLLFLPITSTATTNPILLPFPITKLHQLQKPTLTINKPLHITYNPHSTFISDTAVSVFTITNGYAFIILLQHGKFFLGVFSIKMIKSTNNKTELNRFEFNDLRPLTIASITPPIVDNSNQQRNEKIIRLVLGMLNGHVIVVDYYEHINMFILIKKFENIHTDAARCVTFLHNSLTIASGGWDQLIRIYSVPTQQQQQQPNDQQQQQQQIITLSGHTSDINCIGFCSTLNLVVSGSTDRTIRVWKLIQDSNNTIESGHCMFIFTNHDDSVRTLDVRGTRCCSGSFDFTVRVFELLTGQEIIRISLHWFVQSVVWCGETLSSSPSHILCGTLNNSAMVFDLPSIVMTHPDEEPKMQLMDESMATITIQHCDGVNAVVCDSKGRIALTGCEGNAAYVWDLKKMERSQLLAFCGMYNSSHHDTIKLPLEIYVRVKDFLM